MSSMYLSQTIGWVPGQALRASNSTLPMKRLARVGATGVPMATPLICLKFFLANSNVLRLMTWSSISLSMFLSGWLMDVGESVGSACWRAKLIPNAWGIDGYSALTSRVARSSWFLLSIGTVRDSITLITYVDEAISDGTECK